MAISSVKKADSNTNTCIVIGIVVIIIGLLAIIVMILVIVMLGNSRCSGSSIIISNATAVL